MADILEKIVAQTKEDVLKRKKKYAAADLRDFPLYEKKRISFKEALNQENTVSIIAEIKKASPSKGIIRADFNPLRIAEQYIEAGASALSVLTDEPFFQGSLMYLQQVSELSPIPTLRKDFIVDFYQIEEAKAYGADALLLIVSVTSGAQLSELLHATHEAGLQALVECYTEEEMRSLTFSELDVVGVNNRDLRTFSVDVKRGISTLHIAPESLIKVSESGLQSGDDLKRLRDEGIHAALIGEHFMRQAHPGDALKRILDELHS